MSISESNLIKTNAKLLETHLEEWKELVKDNKTSGEELQSDYYQLLKKSSANLVTD